MKLFDMFLNREVSHHPAIFRLNLMPLYDCVREIRV